MSVLLTGGAGYIGSHTAVAMIDAGYDVIIADNLDNSNVEVIDRIHEITGVRPVFYKCDVSDREKTDRIFRENDIQEVVHLAGLKSVKESTNIPLEYYRNNLDTTLTLLEVMEDHNVDKFVFSSSATVYGDNNDYPYTEKSEEGNCSSPYGWTKVMNERILRDVAAARPGFSVVMLRYFNPIGAHESGLIGEDPVGLPNNLMPLLLQVAVGESDHLTVFGDDYDTPDGTCRRDYLHVMDLAEGHLKAMEYAGKNRGVEVFNLGTGTPYSVLELISVFEKVNGIRVPYVKGPRRNGDLAQFWADTSKAEDVLGWKAKRHLEEMCRDSWNWKKNNPDGYLSGSETVKGKASE